MLCKPNEADYAVEMVANSDLSVLQTAMVRYSDLEELTEQQRLRDIEKEDAWCEDHYKILERMGDQGLKTTTLLQTQSNVRPVIRS
ncbi:MAG: hypothetical protein CMO80_23545 [Verrucomicrobiales bacterium]|nr:hypothetical protein [Verrucomicrobiales bacterium]